MMDDWLEYEDEPRLSLRNIAVWLGWLIAALALVYIFAIPIAEFLLAARGHPNASAAIQLALEETNTPEPLPSYTPPPTHTPYPTYTLPPTFTPYPTYTPFPTSTPTPRPTNTPSPTPIPPGAVLAHIHSEAKAELVVVEYERTERDFHVGVKQGLCSYGGDFTAQGTVAASLDLSQLTVENVRYDADSQTYTLLLPAPRLAKCHIENISLVKTSTSFCKKDSDLLRLLGEVQVMARFTNDAMERGIIDEAQVQAAQIMEDIVRDFTGKAATAEYETIHGEHRMGPSCQLSAPAAWERNADGIWERQD